MRKKSRKVYLFIALLVALQGYLIFGHAGLHLGGQSNGVQNKRVMAEGSIKMDNYQPKHVDGSYVRYLPPLNVQLRPYYRIATIVHIANGGRAVDQQFLVYPISNKIPQKYQTIMKKSKLQATSEEFNVRGSLKKTIRKSASQRKLITFDRLDYNTVYNQKNEARHYQTGAPFVIAPYAHKKGDNSSLEFTANGIESNGHTYSRISTAQAKRLFNKSNHVPLSWGGY